MTMVIHVVLLLTSKYVAMYGKLNALYIGTGKDVRLKDGMVRRKNARTLMYRCTRSLDALQITSPDWLSS